jgi:hypothetical protein
MSGSLDDLEVMALLRQEVKRAGTQAAWARRTGVSTALVNDVLRGNRGPGPAILRGLGLRKVVRYVSDDGDEPLTPIVELTATLPAQQRG